MSIGSSPISGSYQDAHEVLDIDRLLWDARTPHMCACACAHADICVTIDSSKPQRPALTKISCPSDKWIQARWLSMESVHWSKLKIPDVPLESPQRSEHVAIESTTFCFERGISLTWFVRFVAKFYCKAKTNTTSTEISDQKCPEH